MKSNKQRRAELDAKKQARLTEETAERKAGKAAARLEFDQAKARGVPVNREALAPNNSYGNPEFVIRGFYSDQPFACVDCGKAEIWTAHQQKWWYEVAKGYAFTSARRCRNCRRRERERRTEARRVHLEELERKRAARTAKP